VHFLLPQKSSLSGAAAQERINATQSTMNTAEPTRITEDYENAEYTISDEESHEYKHGRRRPPPPPRHRVPFALLRIQQTLGESLAIMSSAMQGLAQRGVHLKKLVDLTDTLSGSAQTLRQRSAHLNRANFCFRLKFYTFSALCFFACLAFLSYFINKWTTITTTPVNQAES